MNSTWLIILAIWFSQNSVSLLWPRAFRTFDSTQRAVCQCVHCILSIHGFITIYIYIISCKYACELCDCRLVRKREKRVFGISCCCCVNWGSRRRRVVFWLVSNLLQPKNKTPNDVFRWRRWRRQWYSPFGLGVVREERQGTHTHLHTLAHNTDNSQIINKNINWTEIELKLDVCGIRAKVLNVWA